jgi:hypothetical protein
LLTFELTSAFILGFDSKKGFVADSIVELVQDAAIPLSVVGRSSCYRHRGTSASTRAAWQAFGPANPDPLNKQVFQLYNLNKDFSQSENIAAQYPQRWQRCAACSSRRRRNIKSFL